MYPQPDDPFFELTRDEPIDLARGALLIAREAYPRLELDVYLQQLDQMATALEPLFAVSATVPEHLELLNRYLFEELGFKGLHTHVVKPQPVDDPRCDPLWRGGRVRL